VKFGWDVSALAGFETWIGLIDHVNTATAANNFAVSVTMFQCFDGGYDFHEKRGKI
jgi:hypothetical protein